MVEIVVRREIGPVEDFGGGKAFELFLVDEKPKRCVTARYRRCRFLFAGYARSDRGDRRERPPDLLGKYPASACLSEPALTLPRGGRSDKVSGSCLLESARNLSARGGCLRRARQLRYRPECPVRVEPVDVARNVDGEN